LINNIFTFSKKALAYVAGAAVILPLVYLLSVIKIFDLFLLEILLFANLIYMILIIPIAVILRK
jgi:hypothetical protein